MISEFAALWIQIRPIRRIRIALNKRRARLGKPLLHIDDEDISMSETQLTIIRTFLKIAGAVLVTHGYMSMADVGVVQVAAEAIIGGVAAIAGTIWSHRTAKAADAAKPTP